MRLNLYWRGYDLVDVEVHLLKRRDDDDSDDQQKRDDEREFEFGFSAV